MIREAMISMGMGGWQSVHLDEGEVVLGVAYDAECYCWRIMIKGLGDEEEEEET